MNLIPTNSLLNFPDIIREWHPTKNDACPEEFTYGSSADAWWLCPVGHVYQAKIQSRAGQRKSGCPYCSGAKIDNSNNLKAKFPHIAAEWHPTKNGKLLPENFMPGTETKVWWKCAKGHSYHAVIGNRTSKKKASGCPYCARRRASSEFNLAKLFPKMVKEEWHPTKNGKLLPEDFLPGSAKKVWWKCPKGHAYQTQVKNRTSPRKPTGCPFCSGAKVNSDNNLATVFPAVAAEWHPTKNGKILPTDVTSRSAMKVWWQCPHGHEYLSEIKGRTRQVDTRGCPHCNPQSSKAEKRLFFELKSIFSDIKSRQKIDGFEVDILLPSIGVAIEYDGNYYHKNKLAYDRRKNHAVAQSGINLIRVREAPLGKIGRYDVIINRNEEITKPRIDLLLSKLVPYSKGRKLKAKINAYRKSFQFLNEHEFIKFKSNHVFPKSPISVTHPQVCASWHPKKNQELLPINFTHGSSQLIWWQCPKGHSFRAKIKSRTSLQNPAYCPCCVINN